MEHCCLLKCKRHRPLPARMDKWNANVPFCRQALFRAGHGENQSDPFYNFVRASMRSSGLLPTRHSSKKSTFPLEKLPEQSKILTVPFLYSSRHRSFIQLPLSSPAPHPAPDFRICFHKTTIRPPSCPGLLSGLDLKLAGGNWQVRESFCQSTRRQVRSEMR